MKSDQEITSLIGELEEAVSLSLRGKFIPGLRGMVQDALEVIKQLHCSDVSEEFLVVSLDSSTTPIQSEKTEDEFILTHWVEESSGLTACCGKTLFELPTTDRIALIRGQHNCNPSRNEQ